jgi:flavodoxin
MSKKLVAYFSATGTTAQKAKALADAAGLEIYEIKPVEPYTKADLNYFNPLSRSTKEMKLGSKHPEIITGDVDI